MQSKVDYAEVWSLLLSVFTSSRFLEASLEICALFFVYSKPISCIEFTIYFVVMAVLGDSKTTGTQRSVDSSF